MRQRQIHWTRHFVIKPLMIAASVIALTSACGKKEAPVDVPAAPIVYYGPSTNQVRYFVSRDSTGHITPLFYYTGNFIHGTGEETNVEYDEIIRVATGKPVGVMELADMLSDERNPEFSRALVSWFANVGHQTGGYGPGFLISPPKNRITLPPAITNYSKVFLVRKAETLVNNFNARHANEVRITDLNAKHKIQEAFTKLMYAEQEAAAAATNNAPAAPTPAPAAPALPAPATERVRP